MAQREFLIDVSRLIWRLWTGRLPTGIDRVCLAYVEHFGRRARAVVQRNGWIRVLAPEDSDGLIKLLLEGGPNFRADLLKLAPGALLRAKKGRDCERLIYLNIGHTGLDEISLPLWLNRHGIKAVFLIHDLIPITHPEFCRAGEPRKHALRINNALRSATGIIGNSRETLSNLAKYASAEKIEMPASISAWISGHRIPENLRRPKSEHPYFIVVGTIEGRKNHMLLLDIWQKMERILGPSTPRLLIVGQRGWEADQVNALLDQLRLKNAKIIEISECADDELARLIGGARALLMPSFAEGFGLPVVEALQLATPVIASDLPVFREIAGDIPTFLDPLDAESWTEMIIAFLEDGPERIRQLELMPSYQPPSWHSHFDLIEAWIATL